MLSLLLLNVHEYNFGRCGMVNYWRDVGSHPNSVDPQLKKILSGALCKPIVGPVYRSTFAQGKHSFSPHCVRCYRIGTWQAHERNENNASCHMVFVILYAYVLGVNKAHVQKKNMFASLIIWAMVILRTL